MANIIAREGEIPFNVMESRRFDSIADADVLAAEAARDGAIVSLKAACESGSRSNDPALRFLLEKVRAALPFLGKSNVA